MSKTCQLYKSTSLDVDRFHQQYRNVKLNNHKLECLGAILDSKRACLNGRTRPYQKPHGGRGSDKNFKSNDLGDPPKTG